MRILLIKPKARLRSVLGLQAFQCMEPLELGYLAAAAGPTHALRIVDLRLTAWPGRALIKAMSTLAVETNYTYDSKRKYGG